MHNILCVVLRCIESVLFHQPILYISWQNLQQDTCNYQATFIDGLKGLKLIDGLRFLLFKLNIVPFVQPKTSIKHGEQQIIIITIIMQQIIIIIIMQQIIIIIIIIMQQIIIITINFLLKIMN